MSTLDLRYKRKALRITSAATATGAAGTVVSIDLTSNFPGDWELIDGTNLQIVGAVVSVIDTSVAGVFSGRVLLAEDNGRARVKTVTLTVTGAAALGPITNAAIAEMGDTYAEFSYTLPANATHAQVAMNEDFGNAGRLDVNDRVSALSPLTPYTFRLRAEDATPPPSVFGPWSGLLEGSTLDTVDPSPGPGVTALQADTLFDRWSLGLHINHQHVNAPFRLTSNWLPDIWEPLADAGFRIARTALATSGQAVVLEMMSEYSTKFGFVMEPNVTTEASVNSNVDAVRNAFGADAPAWFEGYNEPNGPAGWLTLVTNTTEWLWNATRVGGRSGSTYSGIRRFSWSPIGRLQADYNACIANATWIAQVNAGKVDYSNLHNYGNARQPSLTGVPTGGEEGGTGEMTTAQAITDIQALGLGKAGWKTFITETGFRVPDAVDTSNQQAAQYTVTVEAQAKYCQRQPFVNILAGAEGTNTYELFDHYNKTVDYGWVYAAPGQFGTGPFIKRPAYDVCRRTASIFKDPGITFTPDNLDYSFSASPASLLNSDVWHLLWQKRDGKFLLCIWLEVASYNRTNRANITTGPAAARDITVHFGANSPVSSVRYVRPYISSTYTTPVTNVSSAVVSVRDDVTVVEITL